MKIALPVVALAGLAFAVTTLQGGPVMDKETAHQHMRTFIRDDLGLPEIPCIAAESEPGEVCFGSTEREAEFIARVQSFVGRDLQEITGWRSDYGVQSAGFNFRDTGWELGLIFKARGADYRTAQHAPLKDYQGIVSLAVDKSE